MSKCSLSSSKKTNRMRNFHFRYQELCRSKNYAPIPEVTMKSPSLLDFFGDRIHIEDWLLIIKSLVYDQSLQNITLKLRKNPGHVLENLNTIKKARMLKKQPVIWTRFIFCNLINAVSNNIEHNQNLTILKLEGLPIDYEYLMLIAKAVSKNENLQILSFNRSSINDQGCDIICNAVKYRRNIEFLSMSQCQLTGSSGNHIANMIRLQKIYRYSDSWQNALRYNNVDPESIPGLRSIIISQNNIGDNGIEAITEILKDDAFIKEIDVSECGLTDAGAKFIIDCLKLNKTLTEFRIKRNNEISKALLQTIYAQLENLYEKIKYYERKLSEDPQPPEGYTLIKTDELESIIKERDEYKNKAISKLNSRKVFYLKKMRKALSETKYKETLRFPKTSNNSHSHHILESHKIKRTPPLYNNLVGGGIEKSMGDTVQTPVSYQKNQLSKQSEEQNLFKIFNDMSGGDNNDNNYNHQQSKNAPPFSGIDEAKSVKMKRPN
ncbi:protein Cep78 homolog [Condylostylus longicornis]|uniref:protein Cep78 homolog n=1 Tax=Condylostylus longicornis TaxID=2530218 RepID=UPI00244DB9DC|nr:protein Cep78 homolog [Condylostylus longicornis]